MPLLFPEQAGPSSHLFRRPVSCCCLGVHKSHHGAGVYFHQTTIAIGLRLEMLHFFDMSESPCEALPSWECREYQDVNMIAERRSQSMSRANLLVTVSHPCNLGGHSFVKPFCARPPPRRTNHALRVFALHSLTSCSQLERRICRGLASSQL